MRAKYRTKEGLRRTTTGVISELKVAIDLISKGYEVFHAIDPHASCDLLAMKNGEITRVEVRTGRIKSNKISVDRRGNYDLFAVVVGETIFYESETK